MYVIYVCLISMYCIKIFYTKTYIQYVTYLYFIRNIIVSQSDSHAKLGPGLKPIFHGGGGDKNLACVTVKRFL